MTTGLPDATKRLIMLAISACVSNIPYARIDSDDTLKIERVAAKHWTPPFVLITIIGPKDDDLAYRVVTFCRSIPSVRQPVNEDYGGEPRTISLWPIAG